MARRAHLDMQILTERRPGRELVAAAARDFDIGVVRMNLWFHDRGSQRARENTARKGRSTSQPPGYDGRVGLSTKSVNNSVERAPGAMPNPRAQRISLVLIKKRSNTV